MKKIIFVLLSISYIIAYASISFADSSKDLVRKINLARLDSYRGACLFKFSGNQRICRKRVLKQCREMMEKKDCLVLMKDMPESKYPKTIGHGPIQ